MKKILFIYIIFTLSGCDTKKNIYPPFIIKDKQPCVDACISRRFEDFHHEGGFISGSSSMNGLKQNEIWNTINNYCSNLMKNRDCVYLFNTYRDDIYSFDYHYGYYTEIQN